MILNSKKIYNILVILYLSTVLIIGMIAKNVATTIAFYCVFLISVMYVIASSRIVKFETIIISIGGLMLGIMGMVNSGNAQMLNLLYMTFSVQIAILLSNPKVNDRVYYYITIITAIIIVLKIARYGVNSSIFPESSVNYISVFLMIPMCLYYARADLYERRYSLTPAVVSFILSIVAGGRGGFLSLAILVVPLILIKFFRKKQNRIEKVLLGLFLLFVIFVAGYPLIQRVIDNSDFALIANFRNKASLKYSYRYFCWDEYINKCLINQKDLVFGSNIDDLHWANVLAGNLHNSYLFIHAYYGLFGIVAFMVLAIRIILFLVKKKKWVYLFSLLSFGVRAFTDHIFAANRVSPVILALLLAPFMFSYYSREMAKCKSIYYAR